MRFRRFLPTGELPVISTPKDNKDRHLDRLFKLEMSISKPSFHDERKLEVNL